MTTPRMLEQEGYVESALDHFRNGDYEEGQAFLRIASTMLPPLPPEPGRIELIQGSTITPESIVWAWNCWLPLGKLVIFAGQPGTGKTTIMLSIAAIMTIGGTLPDGSTAEVGSVVIQIENLQGGDACSTRSDQREKLIYGKLPVSI